jgi:hypothetical protein
MGHVEYWFRDDVWECVAVAKGLRFLRGLSFPDAEKACQKRKSVPMETPNPQVCARADTPPDPKYGHLFINPKHG